MSPVRQACPAAIPSSSRRESSISTCQRVLARANAVAWNARFEAENGLFIAADGRAEFRGRLRERLAAESPALAAGFHVADLEAVAADFRELRDRLLARPA
jgi:hypothetical protein